MSMTTRLWRNAFTLMVAAGSAMGGFSLTQAECNCDDCCQMAFCHAKISNVQGKFCRWYTDFHGECLYNFTGGGGCWSPCNLVESGTTDIYSVGDDCQAYCYDFYGAECGDGKYNQADSCASPNGDPIAEDVPNFVCAEYVSS